MYGHWFLRKFGDAPPEQLANMGGFAAGGSSNGVSLSSMASLAGRVRGQVWYCHRAVSTTAFGLEHREAAMNRHRSKNLFVLACLVSMSCKAGSLETKDFTLQLPGASITKSEIFVVDDNFYISCLCRH